MAKPIQYCKVINFQFKKKKTQGGCGNYIKLKGEGNGTPLQYSCLENPMDGGAWWAAVHGVAKRRRWLSDFTFTFLHWRRKWQPTPVFLPGESQGWWVEPGGLPSMGSSKTRLEWLSSSSLPPCMKTGWTTQALSSSSSASPFTEPIPSAGNSPNPTKCLFVSVSSMRKQRFCRS